MRALVLIVILATIGCGELIEHNPDFDGEPCLVNDTRYSHTRSFCIGDNGQECFESVHVICDYDGKLERANCVMPADLPQLGIDCQFRNVCWTH
jgi:hypothetical protein